MSSKLEYPFTLIQYDHFIIPGSPQSIVSAEQIINTSISVDLGLSENRVPKNPIAYHDVPY